MSVALYMDVHVPEAIAEQLRRRQVDILTAIEDGAAEFSDDRLLERATELGRILITFDIRFKAMAESWQRTGHPFAGLVYAHPLRVSIGQLGAESRVDCQGDPAGRMERLGRTLAALTNRFLS